MDSPLGTADTLFLEPHSGIAGDMLLAALLDLEDSRFRIEHLHALAHALVPGEFALEAERVWRGSLSGLLLEVRTDESERAPHRHLADCLELIAKAPLSERARQRAGAVFERIARAEALVHDTTPDAIHFHEVGAVDALIDICGAVDALERLGVERVCSTPTATGEGTVQCAHGEMPVPAPATAELLRGVPHLLGGGPGERTTPTGAALLVELVEAFEPPGSFVSAAIGYGAGKRDPQEGPPNILRVQLGGSPARSGTGSGGRAMAWMLEVTLDDMAGEELGFLIGALRDAGALEVWSSAVQMKKNRPGVVLSALCRAPDRDALETCVFAHSTTLGVRWLEYERTECERETIEVELDGELAGKKVRVVRRLRRDHATPNAFDLSVEYDDLATLARETGRPLRELEGAIRTRAPLQGLSSPPPHDSGPRTPDGAS